MPWRASLDSWLVHTGKIRFLVFVCRQGVFQDADGVCERHGWQIQISGFDVLVPAGGAVPCGRNRLALLLDRHHGQTRSALLSCSLHFFFFFFFVFFFFFLFLLLLLSLFISLPRLLLLLVLYFSLPFFFFFFSLPVFFFCFLIFFLFCQSSLCCMSC